MHSKYLPPTQGELADQVAEKRRFWQAANSRICGTILGKAEPLTAKPYGRSRARPPVALASVRARRPEPRSVAARPERQCGDGRLGLVSASIGGRRPCGRRSARRAARHCWNGIAGERRAQVTTCEPVGRPLATLARIDAAEAPADQDDVRPRRTARPVREASSVSRRRRVQPMSHRSRESRAGKAR
jgi:hypothetical protein